MTTLSEKIFSLRKDFSLAGLDENKIASDPYVQFGQWMEEAIQAALPDSNAMTLATCDEHLRPSLRVVLLRNFDSRGFTFFTNYHSRKGRQLAKNPWGSLNFFWPELERQVRIEGILQMVSAAESDEYFNSRPRESQIGAWASPQSEVIQSRAEIDAAIEAFTKKFDGGPVPRPAHWGGFRLHPDWIEFWQGRQSRLHDRIVFSLRDSDTWKKIRLAP